MPSPELIRIRKKWEGRPPRGIPRTELTGIQSEGIDPECEGSIDTILKQRIWRDRVDRLSF